MSIRRRVWVRYVHDIRFLFVILFDLQAGSCGIYRERPAAFVKSAGLEWFLDVIPCFLVFSGSPFQVREASLISSHIPRLWGLDLPHSIVPRRTSAEGRE